MEAFKRILQAVSVAGLVVTVATENPAGAVTAIIASAMALGMEIGERRK